LFEKEKKTVILPVANRVVTYLREQVHRGAYTWGQRIPTERSLAERLQVSRGTVRKALEILMSQRLILRQQGRGTYLTNPSVTEVVPGKGSLIGIMVWSREYFFGKVIQAAAAHAANYGLTLATGTNNTPEEETRHIEAFLRSSIRGVILVPRGRQTRSSYEKLRQKNIPVVLLDTLLPGCEEDFVADDNAHGTHLATAHLMDLGHRQIAYVTHIRGETDTPISSDRRRGFLETCRAGQIEPPNDWILEVDDKDIASRVASLLKLKKRPTAFVTYNDGMALRIMKTAGELGLRVPQDLSVVGFDDSNLAEEFDITTINPEHRELGIASVNVMVEKLENPRPRPKIGTLIRPTLVTRGSTAIPPRRGRP